MKTLTLDTKKARSGSGNRPTLLPDLSLRALIKDPPKQQCNVSDLGCPGLSARITPRGRITWSLRLRVAAEGGQSARGKRAKGKQYRLTLGSYPTVSIKRARARATDYVSKAEAGKHPVRALERKAIARHSTISRLVEHFLSDYACPNLRSWPNAHSMLHRYIVPAWGERRIDSIDVSEAAQLLIDIAKGRKARGEGARSPRPGAAAEVRKWGRRLFSWAIENGLARKNPFEKTKPPTKIRPRQRFLDLHEARAIWAASERLAYPWQPIIQLLLLTGCRLREIAHVRWSWVNIAEQRITIPAQVYKSGRPFLVALPKPAAKILERMPHWNEGDFIFSTVGGAEPVWKIPPRILDQLRADAEEMLERELEHFVTHDFRRTVRTHLSRLKVPEVVGELVLGHALKGVAAVYNVYDFELEKREALQRWAAELIE